MAHDQHSCHQTFLRGSKYTWYCWRKERSVISFSGAVDDITWTYGFSSATWGSTASALKYSFQVGYHLSKVWVQPCKQIQPSTCWLIYRASRRVMRICTFSDYKNLPQWCPPPALTDPSGSSLVLTIQKFEFVFLDCSPWQHMVKLKLVSKVLPIQRTSQNSTRDAQALDML